MKKVIYLFLFSLSFALSAQNQNSGVLELRKLYYQAAVEEKTSDAFASKLEEMDKGTNALLKGYHGMAWMLKAKYAWNPYNKVAHFTKGKKLLEQAILNETSNTELRFLRFSVQSNAPGFLGYSGQLTEDKNHIIAAYPDLKDEDLKKRIRDFMKTCKKCTAEEQNKF